MYKTVTGLIIGNNRKESIKDMLKLLSVYSEYIDIVYFKKVPKKDLFSYKCNIKIS